jgi:hypothetical protein
MEFVVEEFVPGQDAFEYFGFPSQFSIQKMTHSHLSTGNDAMGESVFDVRSGLSLIAPIN